MSLRVYFEEEINNGRDRVAPLFLSLTPNASRRAIRPLQAVYHFRLHLKVVFRLSYQSNPLCDLSRQKGTSHAMSTAMSSGITQQMSWEFLMPQRKERALLYVRESDISLAMDSTTIES